MALRIRPTDLGVGRKRPRIVGAPDALRYIPRDVRHHQDSARLDSGSRRFRKLDGFHVAAGKVPDDDRSRFGLRQSDHQTS